METCPRTVPVEVGFWELFEPWASPAVAVVAVIISFFIYCNARQSREAAVDSAATSREALALARTEFDDARAARDRERYEQLRDRVQVATEKLAHVSAEIDRVKRAISEGGNPLEVGNESLSEKMTEAAQSYYFIRPGLDQTSFAGHFDVVQLEGMRVLGLIADYAADPISPKRDALKEGLQRFEVVRNELSDKVRPWLFRDTN